MKTFTSLKQTTTCSVTNVSELMQKQQTNVSSQIWISDLWSSKAVSSSTLSSLRMVPSISAAKESCMDKRALKLGKWSYLCTRIHFIFPVIVVSKFLAKKPKNKQKALVSKYLHVLFPTLHSIGYQAELKDVLSPWDRGHKRSAVESQKKEYFYSEVLWSPPVTRGAFLHTLHFSPSARSTANNTHKHVNMDFRGFFLVTYVIKFK